MPLRAVRKSIARRLIQRLQVTFFLSEIYLANSLDPGTFKVKRHAGQHNHPNSKEATASSNNSVNTTIMKNKTTSNSNFMNGNESTLPLSGQFDNTSKESESKSAEKQKSEKLLAKNTILLAPEVQEKEFNAVTGISLMIKRKDDEIKALRNGNQSIKAELSVLISCINNERKLITELNERKKNEAGQQKKLSRASESLQLIKGLQIQLSDQPLNQNNERAISGRTSPYLEKKVQAIRTLKKPVKMEIHLPNPNQTPEPTEIAPSRNQFNFPRSSVSSARGFVFKENNNFSSARNTPRTNIEERSSSSNILLRKLSDQSSEYYTNLTFNSSRSPFRLGVRNPKQRPFKVTRVISSKKGSGRQSLEGSTSIGAEHTSLLPDDAETTNHKITTSGLEIIRQRSGDDAIEKLLGNLKDRVSKVLNQYDMLEKREIAKNKQLKNILKEKMSNQGVKKR